jgi:hypothetical protein
VSEEKLLERRITYGKVKKGKRGMKTVHILCK